MTTRIGNKRLSWLIATTFLELNGVELDVDQDEAAHVICALGTRDRDDQRLLDFPGLVKWFNECARIKAQQSRATGYFDPTDPQTIRADNLPKSRPNPDADLVVGVMLSAASRRGTGSLPGENPERRGF